MDGLHVAFSKSDNKLIRYELAAGLLAMLGQNNMNNFNDIKQSPHSSKY